MLSVAQDIVNQLTPYQNSLNTALDVMTSLPLVGNELSDLQEWNTVFQDSVSSLASHVNSLTNGHFELAIPLPSLSKTFTFDLGLDAFLHVNTSGAVSATINPVLNVGFDLTNGVPSLDPTHTGLDIGFAIGLPNFQLTASLNGLLYAQAVDDGTTFSGNLGFNFDTNFDFEANFSGDAHVRMGLSLSLVDPALNASFNPRFSTHLELDWGFDTQSDQLKVPVIAFRNFSLDADSFMQGFLGDTVKGVQKFTKPMQPFIDMFEQPVPIVSSFDSSQTMGDLFLKGAGLSEEQQDSFNTMVKIVKAVNTFDFSGTTGGAVINFGDILLTGDARQTGQFFFDTTQLQGVIDDIMNSPALQEVQDKLETVAEYVGFNADAGFKYPLLENPGPVIGSLLTGQTETMFSYSTGRQHFELGASSGVGIPDLLGFFLNAGVVFDASLSVGYDTQGLLKFIEDPQPESLLHGFYIDNSIDTTGQPIPNVPNPRKTSLYLQGHADISASAVVTVSGGLYADIAFELASNNVSTHVYLDDIITSLSNNVKVFNPSGRLYAAASIELTAPNPVGPDITLFKYKLSEQELLSFNLPPAPTETLPLTVIDVTNQHTLLLDVTKMTANGKVKVQPFHDFTITSGVGYAGDGIRVDYPNEIVLYVERKNDITTNYYNFIGLSGAVPDGVSIDIVDPFTVFTTEGAPDPQPPQTESGVLLAGGKNVVYKYTENAGGSLATVLLVGGYGSNSLTGGTMTFGNFVPADRIAQAKSHFGNVTGYDGAGQALINSRIDAVLAPVSPAGIIGATMTGSRGGLMFGGPGNNSFYATGPGAHDMVGGAWTNNFTISPSFNGVPATYEIDGGPFGQSTLTVRVPSGENVSFDNSAIVDKHTPTLKALAIQANAGLSATAHGIRKVHIVAAVGSDVQLGDTSELDIAFTIVGASRLSFGGSNAPDTFSISSDYNFYGRKDLRYVRQLAAHWTYAGGANPSDISLGLQNGTLTEIAPGNFGFNYSTTAVLIPPYPVDRVDSPIYSIVRTFGNTGRTQTVNFKVDNPAASSLKLDGKGASDTYNITQGLGSFLDIEVRDSDLSTRNTVNVDFRHPVLLPQQATLTNNVLRLNYFTPMTHFTTFWWNGGFFDYIDSFHFYSTSVAYTPGVFFGANVDITLRTGRPFIETIIDRSNPPTGQLATILFDGVLDAYEPPGVLGWDADYISSPSQLGTGRYQVRGDFWRTFFQPNVFTAAYDTQNAEAGVMPVDSNFTNVKVLANAGNLLIIGQGAHTYDVLGNSGTVSMQFTGSSNGRTVNIAGNSGTVNIHEAVVGLPVFPLWASLQVNVGNNGSLAGINGAINLTNASGVVSLKIDDSTNPGPSTSWTVDAMKTVIGDLTIHYAGLNPAPLQNDFGSAYDAFPKAGQVINYSSPPFSTRRVNGLNLPSLGLYLNSPFAQWFQQAGAPVGAQLSTNQPPNTPLTYSATGLPPGLSVDPTTGLILGVIAPQAYLTYIFDTTFSVTTGGLLVQTASRTLQWVVSSGINIDIPSVFTNEPGVEGAPPPNQPLTALNQFNLPVTFTSATGLPPGITFNPATATFGGTFAPGAAQNGPYTVTIDATDGFETSSKTFDWHLATITLIVPPTQLSRHGEAIDLLLQASLSGGGSPMLQINGLPAGLTFNPATKRITGVIDVNANRVNYVSITATNGAASIFKQLLWITLPVGAANYISLEDSGNKLLHEGDNVNWFLQPAYSSLGLPLTYTITGLPPGLELMVASSVRLYGRIAVGSAASSPYHVQLHVTDGFSSETVNFDISVAVYGSVYSGVSPNFSRTSTQGDTIGFTFYAESDLNETITYSATGLPPGITINPQTGFVSGQLELLSAIPGRFQVKVTATTASGSDSGEFLWRVLGADSHILSLPHPSGTGVVTVTSPVGTEISASISPQAGVALPNGVSFPFGFVTFAMRGLTPGQAADVIIAGLDLDGIEDYYKYGATPANATEHWYNFLFGQATDGDSAVGTGMEIVGANIVLHLVDGGRGDDDTSMNGVIFDIGGPAIANTSTPPATIVARHLFYNQSGTSTRYDGNNLAINSFDDLAIATDKTAYLWEDAGAATFANISSYTKGINGIMIDISGSHPSISADDFIFRVGNNNSPGLWGTANAPTSVSVRAGAGVSGSDRVTIIWNGAAAPIKQWLNVIVLANADTGLAQKVGYPVGHGDQFFFGNAVGNTGTGDTSANSLVTAADESAIRANNALIGANVPITNIYDVGRNASVSALDESAARLNGTNPTTTLKYLNLTMAPAAPEADGGDEISPLAATDSDVAAGLAAPTLTNLEGPVPKWLSNRIDSIDLNSGHAAKLFQYLHDTNSPRSRALLQKFDAVADALGLDDELLDELLADLGLE